MKRKPTSVVGLRLPVDVDRRITVAAAELGIPKATHLRNLVVAVDAASTVSARLSVLELRINEMLSRFGELTHTLQEAAAPPTSATGTDADDELAEVLALVRAIAAHADPALPGKAKAVLAARRAASAPSPKAGSATRPGVAS